MMMPDEIKESLQNHDYRVSDGHVDAIDRICDFLIAERAAICIGLFLTSLGELRAKKRIPVLNGGWCKHGIGEASPCDKCTEEWRAAGLDVRWFEGTAEEFKKAIEGARSRGSEI